MAKRVTPKNIAYTAQLIQNCLDNQDTYLDIGRCGLRDEDLAEGSVLGNLLAKCTHLEILILSDLFDENNLEINVRNINEPNFFTQPINAISPLVNLKELICGGEYGSNWEISNISFISGLTHLTHLDLSNNEIKEIKNLDALTQLSYLNLSHNQIKEIKNLDALTQLSYLNLSHNESTQIKNLDALTQLSYLNLSSNGITKIKNLEALTTLHQLDLSYNQITEIKNLDALTALNELDLFYNQITEIKNLEPLTALSKLDLTYNQITEIKNLDTLTALKELNLGDNKIPEIKNLDALTALNQLNLCANEISEIKNLETLTALKQLNLHNNFQIREIKNLESLKGLNQLNLSYNKIKVIENLEALTTLKQLNLSFNVITEIKNIDGLMALDQLELSHNKIKLISIPKYFLEKDDFYLDLSKNPLDPAYGLKLPEGSNSLPYIKDWLNKQSSTDKEAIIYPLKVLLLGNHAVGKSSLVNFLTNQTTKGSTHILRIVDYNSKQTSLPAAMFFDFGGQDFYHGIYRAFFSNGGLQILLYDAAIVQNGLGEDVDGATIYNYNLPYWLGQKNYTEVKNNSKAEPYFLVQTYAERNGGETADIPKKKEDGYKKNFYLSLKHEEDLITEERTNLPIYQADKANFKTHFDHCIEQLAVKAEEPKWFIDFLQFIYNKQAGQYQPLHIVDEVLPHFNIDYEQDIEEKIAILKRYIQQLHLSGLVLYYKDIPKLEDMVWLNPEALVTHIQQNILSKNAVKEHKGVLAEKAFEKLVKDEKILAFLKAQKVVYLHQPDNNDASKNEYIIPNYLPIANAEDPDYQLFTFGIAKPSFILKFKDFIPFGLINQMICFFGQQPDAKKFWRNQLLFTYKRETRVLITICYEDLTIRVCIHSKNHIQNQETETLNYLFYTILALYCDTPIINYIEQGIPPEENDVRFFGMYGLYDFIYQKRYELYVPKKLTESIYISIDGIQFVKYEQLKELSTTEIQITAYGLSDNQSIDLTNTKAIPAHPLGQIIGKQFTKMKKIFISYSKHDESYKEEFRKHLVTLRDNKLIDDFNCKQIDLGAKWDATIQKEVDECDFMFCLVSVDFLNTPYIRTYEVAKAIEKGKTLIPIIIKPCDWETSDIGSFFAAERGHTISLNKEKLLDNYQILANTAEERAAYWVKIVQEFRDKMLK